MAKFTFQFQPLLKIKIQMEENLKNELGKAVQRLEGEKAILMQIQTQKEQCIEEFNSSSGTGATALKLKEYTGFILFLRERIELQKENVNLAQENVDKVREELIKAVQEREILEKLKEKKYKAYLEEQQKEEQKHNDEIISFKHSNRDTGEDDG